MKRQTTLWILVALSSAIGVVIGCRPNADDPAGQAGELADPVRRQNAIANLHRLYADALAKARVENPDRDPRQVEEVTNDQGRRRPGPKRIADASIEHLVRAYVDHPEDPQNGGRILELLREMQDVRSLPAFTKALEWRQDVTEEHAITAARAIEDLEVPDADKGPVVTALGTALDRVRAARAVDNRMRIHMIRTLGDLRDRRGTPILTKIATRLAEDQSFLINRMAVDAIGELRDPAAVPAMVKALFLFAPNDPRLRMNDVAGGALVQIGRPALDPLLALIRGENDEARAIAQNYINAVRENAPQAADLMDPQSMMIEEGCYALGQLGLRDAMAPMIAQVQPLIDLSIRDANDGNEARRQIYSRALSCTTSLVQINREEQDTGRLRQVLTDVYQRIPEEWPPEAPTASRSQLLAAMMHTYDPGLLDFLHGIAANREEVPDFRVVALRSYAFLAAREDLPRIRAVIEAEPAQSQTRTEGFDLMVPALDAAQECGAEVPCWIAKLGDSNPLVARKAAYMLARYGRGNQQALAALVDQLDHAEVEVRGDVLYAVDWVATRGSPEAVAEIQRIKDAEEGRSSWEQIKSLAVAVRSRLQARGSAGGG